MYRAVFALALAAACVIGSRVEARSYVWRITKDHWSAADERGFGRFVQALGETDCSSSESCLRNPANPYRRLDPEGMDIDTDCAKWPYLLRAYYAWHNGLPFSFVSAVSGEGGDLRFTKTSNRAVSRHDVIDRGGGIDGPQALREVMASVFSGTYRIDAGESRGVLSDFYSPAIQPGSIHPGTVVYDINGHVGIVYKVDADGRVYYMDAHPDFSISRSVYGAQFGQSPMQLGGGFKNWRPLQLVGAHRDSAGFLIGGHMALAENNQIGDFSLVQYQGTDGKARDPLKARFSYNGIELGFYEYVRVAVSGGRMDFNPIYELKETIQTMCNDLHDRDQFVQQAIAEGFQNRPHPERLPENIYASANQDWENYSTPSRDARLRAAAAQFYRDMQQMIGLWIDRDPRIVYDGQFLKQDLQAEYQKASDACTITYLSSDGHPVTMTFDDMIHRLFRMSFDPYDCVEYRWGASGDEAESCTDDANKRRWYEAEQRLRNQIDRTYGATMAFDLADLEHHAKGSGVDTQPPIDVKSLIDAMGDRVPFTGMAAVGH